MKIPMPTLGMVRLRETNIGDIIVINPETKNDFWIVVWWNAVGDVRECFKTIKVTKPKYRQVKQRHENRQPSFHTG